MKQIKIIILVFALFTLSSCEKQLDIVPNFIAVESQALGSVDAIDAALSYAYGLEHNNLGTYHIMWAEMMADQLFYKATTYNLATYSNYYNRNLAAAAEELANPTSTVGVNNVKMKEMYNAINCASLVLRATTNGVAQSDITFAANKDRILGECYFLRGVANFQLLRFFSKAWGATADNSQPGIIINKEPVDDLTSQVKARSSVADVYAFIISDLNMAETLLPVAYIPGVHPVGYNGRAYKDAARGYLARVYFQQQDYVNAKTVINRLMGATAGAPSSHPLNIDVTQPFVTRGPDNTDPENIFQTTSSIIVNGPSTFWYSANESIFNIGGANGVASNSFLTDANFYAPDQRWAKLFSTIGGTQKLPLKYIMTTVQTSINIPLIRSAEMILDRAEINAMASNVSDAILDCNLIRTRASIAALPTTILQGPLLDSIRQERNRELCFEGDRLWNLKRLKLPIPAGNRAATATLPWDGLDLVFKYFNAELSRNSLLVNNY